MTANLIKGPSAYRNKNSYRESRLKKVQINGSWSIALLSRPTLGVESNFGPILWVSMILVRFFSAQLACKGSLESFIFRGDYFSCITNCYSLRDTLLKID